VTVTGAKRVSPRGFSDLIDLTAGKPARARGRHACRHPDRPTYQSAGYFLAKVSPETTTVAGKTSILFRIDEGRRLAVSGIRIHGNVALSDREIVRAMKTKPEGFLWFRNGNSTTTSSRPIWRNGLPELYARLGYVDFQVLKDTIIVDRARGKSAPRSHALRRKSSTASGTFDVIGNRPLLESPKRFGGTTPHARLSTLTERATDLLLERHRPPPGVFDRSKWDDATQKLRTGYSNEGYIYASIRPVTGARRGGRLDAARQPAMGDRRAKTRRSSTASRSPGTTIRQKAVSAMRW